MLEDLFTQAFLTHSQSFSILLLGATMALGQDAGTDLEG